MTKFLNFTIFQILFVFCLQKHSDILLKVGSYQVLEIDNVFPIEKSIALNKSLKELYEFSGKIIYVKSLQEFEESLKKYKNINMYWIILIDDYIVYSEISKRFKSFSQSFIIAGILNKNKLNFDTIDNSELKAEEDLNYLNDVNSNKLNSISTVLNQAKTKMNALSSKQIYDFFPLFEVEESDFTNLILNSIENENDNVFCFIKYYRIIQIGQSKITLMITIIKLVLFFIIFIIWRLLKKKYGENGITFQSFLETMINLIILKELIMTVIVSKSNDVKENPSGQYLLTVIYTLECISRTFNCFIMMSFSVGIGIFRQNLSREEMKKIVILFISIYLFFCVDQILDSYFGISIFIGLNFKDIKCIIFAILFYGYLVFCIFKSKALLEQKLIEIQYFATEFVMAIKFKLFLLRYVIYSEIC